MITGAEDQLQPARVAGELARSIDGHHRRFSPIYGGYLSDHGPMGALALSGLGRAPEEVLRWHARYCERLDGIAFCGAILNRLASVPSLLTPSGTILVQHAKGIDLPGSLPPFSLLRQKTYGDTLLSMYKASREE